MPCPGPFHFSHTADYIYDFCLLPDPDVGMTILVCDVEHILVKSISIDEHFFFLYLLPINCEDAAAQQLSPHPVLVWTSLLPIYLMSRLNGTFHPTLLWSSSSSPMWYHIHSLSSNNFKSLISSVPVFNPPMFLFLFLRCYLQSLPVLGKRKCDKQQRSLHSGFNIHSSHKYIYSLRSQQSVSQCHNTSPTVHLITPGNIPTFQSQSPISPRPAHIECHTNNLASSCSHLTYSVSDLFTSLHVYHTLKLSFLACHLCGRKPIFTSSPLSPPVSSLGS